MKRYLVTGASRGIGRAIALRLAAPQTTIILHGRDEKALAEVRAGVEERGATARVAPADLATPEGVEGLVAALGGEKLDVLINNAGLAVVKPLAEISLAEWQRSLAVNVTAPFLLTQKLADRIPRGGSVVNILSIAARTGFPGWSGYCASKFALEGFSQAVREEFRPRGVRVINIYPAATDTEIWEGVEGEWPREKMMRAEEIAGAVSFALAQPETTTVENITLSATAGAL